MLGDQLLLLPLEKQSIFLSFIDDYSRKVWVYVMKAKSDSFENFKAWKALVENQSGSKLKV